MDPNISDTGGEIVTMLQTKTTNIHKLPRLLSVGNDRTATALAKDDNTLFETHTAHNCLQAIEILEDQAPFDVILIDSYPSHTAQDHATQKHTTQKHNAQERNARQSKTQVCQNETQTLADGSLDEYQASLIEKAKRLNPYTTILLPPPSNDPPIDLVILAVQRSILSDQAATRHEEGEYCELRSAIDPDTDNYTQKQIVLVVDDDPSALNYAERILKNSGYTVITATNGKEAINIIRDCEVQFVVTDWCMPELDGLELCIWIRGNEHIGLVYVMLITAHYDRQRLLQAFGAGADDFLKKPYDPQELVIRMQSAGRVMRLESDLARHNLENQKQAAEMAILNSKLHELATTDELTQLLNRRQGINRLQDQWENAARYKLPLSVILFDIDHFKKFNDTHGHAAGDAVLVSTAKRVKELIRTADFAVRIGGEEFLIVCPNTPCEGAMVLAERLREAIAEAFVSIDGNNLSAAISLGVAERDESMDLVDDLVKAADVALYEAKNTGRNRTCLHNPVAAKV